MSSSPTTGERGRAALLIAATHSGAGKTTVTGVLMAALRRRGLAVQPFKVGPDFIDAAHHAEVCGRPSINLDTWLQGEDGMRRSFERWSADADIAVIEAMGGLFDGVDGTGRGSPAELAKLLGVPVVVVLDVWGMTRTAAPILRGLRDFDPEVRVAGCVLNRVGSPGHAGMVIHSLPDDVRGMVIGSVAASARRRISTSTESSRSRRPRGKRRRPLQLSRPCRRPSHLPASACAWRSPG